jgi:hypothetical protein
LKHHTSVVLACVLLMRVFCNFIDLTLVRTKISQVLTRGPLDYNISIMMMFVCVLQPLGCNCTEDGITSGNPWGL